MAKKHAFQEIRQHGLVAGNITRSVMGTIDTAEKSQSSRHIPCAVHLVGGIIAAQK